MQWSDDAIVIGQRVHGETAVLLELLTREHGRHLGILHGGRSRRIRPVIQPGNGVSATWRARLDEHLGQFTVEGALLRSDRLIASAVALYGVAALALHLRLLPERDPHPLLFEAAAELLDGLADPAQGPALFVRFELMLLTELGYGLDLGSCAATGRHDDLAWVSPKSGRAVSREAGEPYRGRLLALPRFLATDEATPEVDDLAAAFRLTGFFLETRVFAPLGRPLPEERARFVAHAVAAGRSGRASAMDGPVDAD